MHRWAQVWNEMSYHDMGIYPISVKYWIDILELKDVINNWNEWMVASYPHIIYHCVNNRLFIFILIASQP